MTSTRDRPDRPEASPARWTGGPSKCSRTPTTPGRCTKRSSSACSFHFWLIRENSSDVIVVLESSTLTTTGSAPPASSSSARWITASPPRPMDRSSRYRSGAESGPMYSFWLVNPPPEPVS